MSKILQIIFLLSFLLFSCQKSYQFDKEIVYSYYKGNSNRFNSNQSIYINSNDSSYFLELFGSSENRFALLYDLKNNIRHYFDMSKTDSKKYNYYTFKYKNSQNIQTDQNIEKPNFEFVTTNNENKLIIYKNDKKKKIIFEASYIEKESETNLFYVFRASVLEPYLLFAEIDPNKKIMITSAEIKKDVRTLHYELNSIVDNKLQLEIPNTK